VHADAARLAAFEDNIAALCALDLLHEDLVALSLMCGDVFALSLEVPILCPKRLAVLACL
jgi:hypothetical protein